MVIYDNTYVYLAAKGLGKIEHKRFYWTAPFHLAIYMISYVYLAVGKVLVRGEKILNYPFNVDSTMPGCKKGFCKRIKILLDYPFNLKFYMILHAYLAIRKASVGEKKCFICIPGCKKGFCKKTRKLPDCLFNLEIYMILHVYLAERFRLEEKYFCWTDPLI